MDNAGNPAFELGPDREDEAAVARRDQGVGQELCRGSQDPLQGVLDAVVQRGNLFPAFLQFR